MKQERMYMYSFASTAICYMFILRLQESNYWFNYITINSKQNVLLL